MAVPINVLESVLLILTTTSKMVYVCPIVRLILLLTRLPVSDYVRACVLKDCMVTQFQADAWSLVCQDTLPLMILTCVWKNAPMASLTTRQAYVFLTALPLHSQTPLITDAWEYAQMGNSDRTENVSEHAETLLSVIPSPCNANQVALILTTPSLKIILTGVSATVPSSLTLMRTGILTIVWITAP